MWYILCCLNSCHLSFAQRQESRKLPSTSTDILFPSLQWEQSSTCLCHVFDHLKRMRKEEEECGEGLNRKFRQHFPAKNFPLPKYTPNHLNFCQLHLLGFQMGSNILSQVPNSITLDLFLHAPGSVLEINYVLFPFSPL